MKPLLRSAVVACGLVALAGCPSDTLQTPELVFELNDHWPSRSTYPGVGDGRVLITNSLDDSVSIFDAAQIGQPTLPLLARVPVGLLPVELEGVHHATLAPGGDAYFVGLSNYAPGSGSGPHGAHGTGTADGHVLKIRAEDNVQIGEARVDRNPGDVTITSDGKHLLVSHYDLLRVNEVQARGGTIREMDSRLVMVNAETMEREALIPACPAAHGIIATKDGSRAYLACMSDEVAVVDLVSADHPVTRVPLTPNGGDPTAATHLPYALALSADEKTLWVSCLDGKDVHAVDTTKLMEDPTRHANVPGAASFPMYSADESKLYVPHQSSDGIAVVNPANGALLRDIQLPTCIKPHSIRLAPDNAHALVICEGNHVDPGALVVLDLDSEKAVSTSPVGIYPDFVGVLRRSP